MLPNQSIQPYRVELLFPKESRWVDVLAEDDLTAIARASELASDTRAPVFRLFDRKGGQLGMGVAQ